MSQENSTKPMQPNGDAVDDSETKTDTEVLLLRACRELKQIRELLSKTANFQTEAEAEIPEKVRRFAMYMHDIHDITYMYESRGQQAPPWVLREMERCDDRFRQLLTELLTEGGAFEKVRREMAEDPDNRWDHTRLITKGVRT